MSEVINIKELNERIERESVFVDTLRQQKPSGVEVCALLMKPEKLKVALDVKYCCMEIPNDFIVGYGLDYEEYGRNLRDIYTVVE